MVEEEKLIKLKKNVEQNPDSPLARFALANEFYKKKMYIDAIDELKRYLQINDDEGSAYRMLAYSYEEIGKIDEAIESLRKGVEAAQKHGHDSMVEEFNEELERLQD